MGCFMEDIILIGGGQHCGVVMYNVESQRRYHVIGVLDGDAAKKGTISHGVEILGDYSPAKLDAIQRQYKTNKFFIAFGAMKYRRNTFKYMINRGWEPVNIIHPNAVISPHAKIGKGVLIECGCLITPNPVIGDNVVVNTGSQVNHDNVIGDHVYIASGVVLSGGVSIGENTLLDDGVVVTLGKRVGENCLVGAGAIVTKDIPSNKVAYGNPCRFIRDNK